MERKSKPTAETEEFDLDSAEEIDLDSAEDQDLEDALRDALEAVERDGGRGEEAGEIDGAFHGAGAAEGGSDELETLRREVAELRDRSVRTLADFDNYRKRVERERDEQHRYAGADVLREMLAVVDNLERALESEGGLEELRQGVELISKQMADLLRRHGVKRVKAVAHAFDPTVHDAVSRIESESVLAPTVHEELLAGYVMKDRLLRPATVVVAVPEPTENGG